VTSCFLPRPAPPPGGPTHPTAPRQTVFTPEDFARASRFFDLHPELPATPLVALPALARRLGLGAVFAKDESTRFGLNAFKLLGARFAIEQLLADGDLAPGQTLVCASEGNHGRAVAHTARRVGCPARVYLSHTVAEARAAAIAGEGAAVVRVEGSYDDAVRQAAADAAAHGWTVVSDTAWPGYERVPWLIMLGYTRLVEEVAREWPEGRGPDAIFVPGGVGGLLAAVAAWSAWHWGSATRVVGVEPSSAACLQASARAARPTVVPGPFDTMMGPLRCGEVSPLAFEAAFPVVAGYVAIDDDWAVQAMRLLANPEAGDLRITAGASGAASLGGLLATLGDADARPLRDALGLDEASTVVTIVSEGMTDPVLWQQIVGRA
jgi:diaminopropionate ammonia-lyase